MAHRRRYRRRYGALEVIPGLGGVMSTLKSHVKGTDVVVGGLAALAGIWGVKKVMNTYLVGKVPEIVLRVTPALSGVLAGTALYYLQKKGNRARGMGHAIGAVSAGIAINAMNELKVQFPELADVVDLRLSGLILNDPQLRGIIVNEPGHALGAYGETDFNALAMVGDNVDDMYSPDM